MTTFIASFHAGNKGDIAMGAFFLFVSVFCMKWCTGHKTKFGFKINFNQTFRTNLSAASFVLIFWCSFTDACWIYSFVFFCWRCLSNALKQENQATTPQGSSTWIPYFLLALPAINISIMEWRNFLGVYWVFTLSRSRCFSSKLKQDNQATIHQTSSTWIPYFGLETNNVCRFLWCSGSVCSCLLSFFYFYQAQRVCSQWTQTG